MTPYVEDVPTVNFMAKYAAQLAGILKDPSVLVLVLRWAKPADIPTASQWMTHLDAKMEISI
jgi:hypothetical protein